MDKIAFKLQERLEILQEVLEWLEKEMIIDGRELIVQSFKDRFNIE